MEVIIIMAIIGAIVFLFKRTFSGFIYAVGLVDIFLRILEFLKGQLLRGEVFDFVNRWFPESIPDMIRRYTEGDLTNVIIWIYVVIMIIFEVYIIKEFVKRR